MLFAVLRSDTQLLSNMSKKLRRKQRAAQCFSKRSEILILSATFQCSPRKKSNVSDWRDFHDDHNKDDDDDDIIFDFYQAEKA